MNLSAEVLVGDNRKRLQELTDASVQTVVTSPPYFGLRDYGHEDQIGLEQTPQAFVEELCKVFDEIWRVLKDDGTVWVNLGDSYAQSGQGGGGSYGDERPWWTKTPRKAHEGLKPKDLIGIPWRFAFAMQDRGWYLRSDIIWHKPNPMPESVTDRPTKSHEYIFLLTKSPQYFYDHEAIKEEGIIPAGTLAAKGSAQRSSIEKVNSRPPEYKVYDGMRNKRSVWTVNTKPYKEAHFATYPPELITPCILAGTKEGDLVLDPFSGSGTTGEVALQHGRNYIGLELNHDYAELSRKRLTQAVGMFGDVTIR